MRTFLSLGAGVQSTTVALMAAQGLITPMPECAIFADTQAEPRAVYEHLEWLTSGVLPFPVHRVTEGSLTQIIGKQRKTGQWKHMPIPAFIAGANGKAALANRSCTRDFKIDPIRRKVRELVGLTRKKSPLEPIVEQWIGISLDEAHRMKDSREAWVSHRWPLIEHRMTRTDCLSWLAKMGYPTPPKSSCTFCPFHDRTAWEAVKADPAAWAEALEVDERIRDLWRGRVPSGLYLHRSLKPLAEALAEPATDADQIDMFGNECEGMCGV